jgi:Mrp family chromosome partitioning ATPase
VFPKTLKPGAKNMAVGTTQQGPAQGASGAEDVQQQRDEAALTRRMADISHKLLVLSGKGGVGKSTVAANLAVALWLRGNHVGLLDVDVHGPSIPKLMGLESSDVHVVDGELVPVHVGENLSVMSIGFLLPRTSDAVVWRGPKKHGVIRQFLQDVNWGPLDYLVVDSPPGTGDEPLSVVQLVGTRAEALLVTTPQQMATADVRRCVTFCRQLSLPILGMLENMSGLRCPHCGEPIDLFKQGGGRDLALEVGAPLLGQIPIDPAVVVAGDAGVPILPENPPSPATQALLEVVDQIVERHAGSLPADAPHIVGSRSS